MRHEASGMLQTGRRRATEKHDDSGVMPLLFSVSVSVLLSVSVSVLVSVSVPVSVLVPVSVAVLVSV